MENTVRIKDLEAKNINEYVDTSAHDPVFSNADNQRILSVNEADFGPAVSGDDLIAHTKKLLGIK